MQHGSPNVRRSATERACPLSTLAALRLLVLGLCLPVACRPPAASDGGPALSAEAPHGVEVAAASAPLAPVPSTGRGSALLIAINDYLYDDDIPDLRGTINDATAMKDLLIRRFGFDPSKVVLLRDSEATKERVLAAFRGLIDRTEVDSPVVIYDSSHGSEVWDESGDEPKAYDQTLVMHDSGRSQGRENRDLTDDELNGLLRELNRKTKHVTLIFDSCHSGTAARASATPRAAPPDCRGCSGAACGKCEGGSAQASRAAPSRPARHSDGARGHVGFGPDDLSYVLISGAASDEFSYERVVDGKPMGALTWALTRALWQAPPGTSYRDVMAQVAAEVTSSLPAQHPQLEGRNIDTEVFGVTSLPVEPFLEVRATGGGLTLLGGAIHGVSVGSRYDVYAPGTRQFDPASAIGALTVTQVGAVTAMAERTAGTATLESGARAIETHHQFDRVSLRVRVDDRAGAPPALARAADALARDSQIALVEADYDLLLRWNGKQLEVERSTELDASGSTATPIPNDDGAAGAVVELVRRWARWNALQKLTSIPADAEVTFTADAAGKSVSAGTQVTFSLVNASARRYYLSLFALSSDGSISLVYPEAGANEYIEPGGQWKKTLQTCVPSGKSSVRDVAKVFLTREPHQLAFLEQGALSRNAAVGRSALGDVLATQALGVTRGLIRPTQGAQDGWQTRQVAYDVRAEPGAIACPGAP
jgi:hypothetical protein